MYYTYTSNIITHIGTYLKYKYKKLKEYVEYIGQLKLRILLYFYIVKLYFIKTIKLLNSHTYVIYDNYSIVIDIY